MAIYAIWIAVWLGHHYRSITSVGGFMVVGNGVSLHLRLVTQFVLCHKVLHLACIDIVMYTAG